jgi:hypothetical protein
MALAPLAQNVIEVAQGKFRSLLGVPVGDIVLLAAIPGYWYHFTDEIELSREIWSTVRDVVHSVTVALDSGASPVIPDNEAADPLTYHLCFFQNGRSLRGAPPAFLPCNLNGTTVLKARRAYSSSPHAGQWFVCPARSNHWHRRSHSPPAHTPECPSPTIP